LKKSLSIIIFYSLCLFSCTEEYSHQADDYINELVVQGLISDVAENCEVRLSRSLRYNDYEFVNESNALVYVSDNYGEIITFEEKEDGVYIPEDKNWKAKTFNEYYLTIITEDGNEFVSEQVTLYDVPVIDSVYALYNEIYSFDNNEYIKGIDICVDFSWEEGKEYFLRWDYIETIKIWPRWEAINIEAPYTPCWQEKNSTKILTFDTNEVESSSVKKKPVIHLSEYDYQPHFGYSVLIRQSSINKKVYDFWQMVKDNSENNGDLFDNIPYSAVGNIECVSNQSKRVFGYFSASSQVKKRIYIKAPIFEIPFTDINEGCTAKSVLPSELNSWLEENAYFLSPNTFTLTRRCVDCTAYANSTREKPDFWDYD
jgi:hypothetical protein